MADTRVAEAASADASHDVTARWLAADEAAVMTGRTVTAVYRLAHRHRWRRYTHLGRTYYHPGDVEHTMAHLTKPR